MHKRQFEDAFFANYNNYMLHLNSGGRPAEIPQRHQTGLEDSDYIHPSDLLSCPKAAAQSRAGEAPVIPELAKEAQPYLMHIFEYGRRAAAMIQESLYWNRHKPTAPFSDVFVEEPLINHRLRLSGTCDAIVMTNDSTHILEFKHRGFRYVNGRRMNEAAPDAKACYQLLAYRRMLLPWHLGLPVYLHLVLFDKEPPKPADPQDRPGIHLWTLDQQGSGYVLTDTNDQPWHEAWNVPEFLNDTALEQEIARQRRYKQGDRTCPIPDPINHEDGWQCIKRVKYPNGATPGLIRPDCAYSCHFNRLETSKYWKGDDSYIAVYPDAVSAF